MKKLAALCLLLVSTAALAVASPSNPCDLTGQPPAYYDDFTKSPPPPATCAPWPFGEGTPAGVRTTSLGSTVWWYCPMSDGTWSYTIRAATAAVLTPDYLKSLTADIASVMAATDTTAELNRITAARISLPMNDPSLAAVWCPWWPTIYANKPPRTASADGTLVPPDASLVDAKGVVWTITAAGFAARDGVATNGRALKILSRAGTVYVLSPTGGYWWKWVSPTQWLRLTTSTP